MLRSLQARPLAALGTSAEDIPATYKMYKTYKIHKFRRPEPGSIQYGHRGRTLAVLPIWTVEAGASIRSYRRGKVSKRT